MRSRLIFAVALSLVTSLGRGACATPSTVARLAEPQSPAPLREADSRVEAVAYRVAVAATPWCANLAPTPGWVLHHLAEYPAALRADLIAVYRLDQGPGIVAIAPGSPAERAGLQPGDTIIAVGSTALTPGPLPRRESREPGNATDDRIETALRNGRTSVHVLRGGNSTNVMLDAAQGCPTRVRIARATSDNAFADGRYAIFSEKLVALADTPDELAAVVAHELAHNYLGHYANRLNKADTRRTRDQEAEADAFGLRLMAAAGYDPHAMLRILDRLLEFNPIELIGLGSHYPKGQRLAAIRRELALIDMDPARVTWKGIALPRPAR